MHRYDNDQGLGVSVLIYVAALVGGLVLIVTPVYLANRPVVYQNSGVKRFDQVLLARAERDRYPLARLERPDIVDPAIVAALNAKAKAERHPPSARVPHRAARARAQTKQQTYADATPARHSNPFALFFSLF